MNDIELKRNLNSNTFDWRFVMGDVSVVNGVQALRNSVIHAVMLKYDELEQELYKNKGSRVHEFIRAKPSKTILDYMAEAIKAAVKELPGVYDATVTIQTDSVSKAISDITIIKDDGSEVIIGAF